MRRVRTAVLCLLVVHAAANPRKSFRETVREVVTAYQSGEAGAIEAALAAAVASGYEPWFFVDALLDGGHDTAAAAYAARIERLDAEALRSFARTGGAVAGHRARRQAVYAAAAKLQAKHVDEALALLAPHLEDAGDFSSFRVSNLHARVLQAKGDRRGALAAFRQAFARTEALGWTGGAIEMGFMVGSTADSLRQLALAEATWRHVLALEEKRGNERNRAGAMHNLGRALRRSGRLEEALAAYGAAMRLHERLGMKAAHAGTLTDVALIHEKQGKTDDAIDANERAIALYRAAESPPGIVLPLSNVGNFYRMRGRYGIAAARFEEALPIAKARMRRMVAKLLISLGKVALMQGRPEEALARFREAGPAAKAARRRVDEADARKSAGVALHRLGRLPEAFRALDASIELARRAGAAHVHAAALISKGALHNDAGDRERALAAYERALDVADPKTALHEHLSALKAIAGIEARTGKAPQAVARWERVVAMATEAGYRRDAAGATMNIGVTHLDAGRFKEARTWFEKALAFGEALGTGELRIRVLMNLAHAERGDGQLDPALRYADAAVQLADEAEIGVRLLGALALRGDIHVLRRGFPAARADARRAVALVATLTQRLSDESSARAKERHTGAFEVGLRAALGLASPEDALFFLEEARTRTLLSGLASRDEIDAAVLPPKLREQDARARAAEAAALRAYHEARATRKRKAMRETRAALRAARARVAEVVETIRREAKDAARVVYPETAGLADVQATLAPAEALVVYGLTSKSVVALVVTKEKATPVVLGERAETRALLDATLLPEAPYVDAAALARLRERLTAKIRLPAGAKRVLVSPPGALGVVPFASAFPGRTTVMVPSGTVLRWLRQRAATPGEQVLAVGAPVYEGDPRRLASLPGTRAEVEAIGDVTLLADKATVPGFWTALGARERWRAVHLACHALLDEQRPLFSRLALTGGSLRALDVFTRRIPADLVVLSACDTARGKTYEAEGVFGLTRAFMLAGAPRVICSLWKVDDEATKALMTRFYDLWTSERDAAAALAQAQAFVRGHERWQHPTYWAAWTLWGLPD